jgi:hypothetical protein
MHEPAAMADTIARELNLRPDQRASLEKILAGLREIRQAEPGYAAHRERWTKILNAFQTDRFVLDEVAPMGDVAARSARRLERMLWAAEAILPVLDPEQRKGVADKVREFARGSAPSTRSANPGMSPSEEE